MNNTFEVPEDGAGARLDVFLTSVLASHSRSNIQRLIKDGRVLVDGRSAKSNLAMKAGQSVDVKVDAFGTKYHGYIESLSGATGAKTSLLPPENATGNYVKVVQRLPVRIRLKPGEDPGHPLRPGMSVEPKVWLNTGS